MERQGNEVHIEKDEARAGSTPHIVRYVLGISMVLIVVAFAIIFFAFARFFTLARLFAFA